ncbi:MAG: exodeoxyribonuclease III [Saprospiraceae bacterium]
MKLISWNVNGVRAVVSKNFLQQFKTINADIFCLQETKAQEFQVKEALTSIEGYHIHCNEAEKKGYSGVCIISKEAPLSVTKGINIEEHDNEGRVITTEFKDFYLVNVYVPNSGDGLKRLSYRQKWDLDFGNFLSNLQASKPVIVTGDFNVAHQPIDLARPKENYNKTSGYTQAEIDGMSSLLNKGFVDSFRHQHPETVKYSFWSARFGARAKNLGWRLDYFLVDKKLSFKNSFIMPDELGSDHCPIGLEL